MKPVARIVPAVVLVLITLPVLADCGGETGTPAADAGPDPNLLLHVPSPDWSEQIIYFVVTDRFDDGDPSNNDQAAGETDPSQESHYSGGDLQGVIDRLDYIQQLGATAVWITPPVANQWWDPLAQFSGYHGYWGRDFKRVDAHCGTLETYRALSDALHRRGMFLIQDIVPNHTGNFFTYDASYDPSDPELGFALNSASLPTAAPEMAPFDLNDVTRADHRAAAIYHWTPTISDFNDDTQRLTYQLSDLDDINTENPVVRHALRDAYGYWIREVGVDAFRIDTVKFVEHDFWNDFVYSTDEQAPGMAVVAAETGRQSFLTFGEVFEVSDPMSDGGEVIATSYLGTAESPELTAVLGFPLYEEMGRVFARGRPTRFLSYRLERSMDRSLFLDPFITPNFLDNHDLQRFLESGSKAGLEQALTVLMTIPGIPVIYYGTEQGFTVPRASMFAEGWMSGGEDHFDTESELYTLIAELAALRTQSPVLTQGELTVLRDTAAGPGVFAFERQLVHERLIVLLNTAEEPVLVAGLEAGLDEGEALTVRLDRDIDGPVTAGPITAGPGGQLSLELPERATLVLAPTSEGGPVDEPGATIAVSTLLEGQTFSEDVTVTGTIEPADAALVMVVDDYVDRATTVDTDEGGDWSAVLPVSQFPFGSAEHTVTFWAPEARAASPRLAFTSDVAFDGEIVTVDDPLGDDAGPEGAYTYPTDVTFGHQMDIDEVRLLAGPATLVLELTMADWTDVWGPTNGFDHVSFTIYFDLPDSQGLTMLPKIHATAPEGFAWDVTHFAHGFGNSLHGTQDASATEWGEPLPGTPEVRVTGSERRIAFDYDRQALGIDGWSGVGIYITTWDFNGLDNRYRLMSPEGGQWIFGGGEQDDPFIMDEVGPVIVP